MSGSVQAQIALLGTEVQAAAVPEACKLTATRCLGQLPALYDKLQRTHESRYSDEITRLVRWMLKGLVQSTAARPEVQQLEAKLIDRLRLLHERFGLSPLNLKPSRASPPRPGKAGPL
jgi:hypothetical protein